MTRKRFEKMLKAFRIQRNDLPRFTAQAIKEFASYRSAYDQSLLKPYIRHLQKEEAIK